MLQERRMPNVFAAPAAVQDARTAGPFAGRTAVKTALASTQPVAAIVACGWVRTRRDAKDIAFLEINDGSCLVNIQAIVDAASPAWPLPPSVNTGAGVAVSGALVASPGKGQLWEIHVQSISVLGEADPETFPLQKKRHSDEFLRTIAHLRPRTNKFGAMFRIRSEAAFAVHEFFRERGFFHIHTPILTGSDAEGAGEMFRVTTLPVTAQLPQQDPFAGDFFGRECSLTVSGQLEAENMALALGKVYAFGPTFRAENSNTPRHCAEFWMIEPEAAFADLEDNMNLAEDLTREAVRRVLERCPTDIELFNAYVDSGLLERLHTLVNGPFARISYADAVVLLQKSGRDFEFPVFFGADLQTEHERFLAEEYFGNPVIVRDYPKNIKAFYMRMNDDERTVAAMDLLVPRIGELIGGSQREERLPMLEKRLRNMGRNAAPYWWYLELRRFGSVPHAGFGMGFERLLMLLTGVANIRDVIPFPRTPNNLEV
jgi:asparaginyl-tRNA synthetase